MLSRRIHHPLLLRLILVGVVLTPLTLAHTPASAATPSAPGGKFTPKVRTLVVDTWSGLVYKDPKNVARYTVVKASWRLPAVKCPVPSELGVAIWVGLGDSVHEPLAQTGTETWCDAAGAHTYPWWEVIPPLPQTRFAGSRDWGWAPGDLIRASVIHDPLAGIVDLQLENVTRGTLLLRREAAPDVPPDYKPGSAECIVERPEHIKFLGPDTQDVLPDFGTVSFTNCLSHGLDKKGNAVPTQQVQLYYLTDPDHHPLANPSPLTPVFSQLSDKSVQADIKVTWKGPGKQDDKPKHEPKDCKPTSRGCSP
jgi:Peptidase A4 family